MSAELRARAVELRARGLSYDEILAELGGVVSKSTIARWLNPAAEEESRAAARRWKAAHRKPCSRCGALKSYDATGELCGDCSDEERFGPRRRRIIALWNAGVPTRDIAEELGVTESGITTLIAHWRSRNGIDLPLRRARSREQWAYVQRRREEGATNPQIADELGTTTANVSQMLTAMRRAGIDIPYKPGGRPGHDWPELQRMYLAGMSYDEIAAELGEKRSTISMRIAYLRRRGVDLPYRISGPRRVAA